MTTMKILGLVNGSPTVFDREYVVEYDPGRRGVDRLGNAMLCHLRTSPDLSEAFVYESTEDAWNDWQRVDPSDAVRPDGKPNRPLTAFNVKIENR